MQKSRAVKLFLGLLPLLEIAGFIIVGGWMGVIPTLLLIVATTVLGLFVLRVQGFITLAKMQQKLAAGQFPETSGLEGALLMFGGFLLLLPGFITDICGLVLLVPEVRKFISSKLQDKTKEHTRVIEGEFHREDDKF